MLKEFPSDKINGTKKGLFFTFNLQFLYELKYKVHLSKTVCGIFHFRLVFIKVYIFVQPRMFKKQRLFDFKTS